METPEHPIPVDPATITESEALTERPNPLRVSKTISIPADIYRFLSDLAAKEGMLVQSKPNISGIIIRIIREWQQEQIEYAEMRDTILMQIRDPEIRAEFDKIIHDEIIKVLAERKFEVRATQ